MFAIIADMPFSVAYLEGLAQNGATNCHAGVFMSRGHQLTAIDRKKQGVEDSTCCRRMPRDHPGGPSERTYGGSKW